MSHNVPLAGEGGFPATRWSLVLAAGGTGPDAQRALGLLCEDYWPPLFRYLRRTGFRHEDAEDLLQGFLASFIQRNDFKRADRTKGRFRSYLLGALKHYVNNARERAESLKHGGDKVHVPLVVDMEAEERRFAAEPSIHKDPDRSFHREWGLRVLDRALGRVRDSYASRGDLDRYEAFMGLALGRGEDRNYQDAAERLRVSVSLVKKGIGQFRRSLRNEVRREIADTVDDASQVDDEMKFLLDALDD